MQYNQSILQSTKMTKLDNWGVKWRTMLKNNGLQVFVIKTPRLEDTKTDVSYYKCKQVKVLSDKKEA